MVREIEFVIFKIKYILVEKGCIWGFFFIFGMLRWNWFFLGCKDDGFYVFLYLDESVIFKICFFGERINIYRNVFTFVVLKRFMVFCWNFVVGS